MLQYRSLVKRFEFHDFQFTFETCKEGIFETDDCWLLDRIIVFLKPLTFFLLLPSFSRWNIIVRTYFHKTSSFSYSESQFPNRILFRRVSCTRISALFRPSDRCPSKCRNRSASSSSFHAYCEGNPRVWILRSRLKLIDMIQKSRRDKNPQWDWEECFQCCLRVKPLKCGQEAIDMANVTGARKTRCGRIGNVSHIMTMENLNWANCILREVCSEC